MILLYHLVRNSQGKSLIYCIKKELEKALQLLQF